MGTPRSLPHFLLIFRQLDIQWSDSSIPQQQVSRARQSTPDSVSFVFCPTYGWEIAYMKHWYTAMALLAFNTCKEVMCIRHGGRWEGLFFCQPLHLELFIGSDLSLCLTFFFFLVSYLLEYFSFGLYSSKSCPDIDSYIWKKFLSSKRPQMPFNSID